MPEKAAQTKTTYDHQKPKRVCFETHNKPTFNEHGVETNMQKKARVNDLAAQRGNLPLASLGDKNYKDVAYEPGFFLAGGLIPGSTNKVHQRSSGNGKAVDFYSGLKLDGPLNKNSKNYVTVCREQQHAMEVSDVSDLKKWERNIL